MVKRVVLGVVLAMVVLIGGLIFLLMGVANQPQGAGQQPVAAVSPQQPAQKVPTLPSLAEKRAEREAAVAKAAEKTATKKVATSPTSNGEDGSTFFLTGFGNFLWQLLKFAITIFIIVVAAIAIPAILPGITVVGVYEKYWEWLQWIWKKKIRPAVPTEEETDHLEET